MDSRRQSILAQTGAASVEECIFDLQQDIISAKRQIEENKKLLDEVQDNDSFFREKLENTYSAEDVRKFEDLLASNAELQESLADRFKALVVDAHLLEHNIYRAISLHGKMNDLIRPVWNLVKSEKTEYYQRVFASILSHDLLKALHMQNKKTIINAILDSYVIKTLAKLSWTVPLLDQDSFYQFK